MGALSYWTFRVYLLSIYNKFSEKMVLGENQVEVGRQDKVQEESRVGGVQKVNYQVPVSYTHLTLPTILRV